MTTSTLPAPGDSRNASRSVVRVYGDFRFHVDGDLLALAFSSDGFLWSVEEPGVLRVWNPATGEQRQWHSLSDLETLWVFSSDARLLASGSDDLSLWDTTSGELITTLAQPDWVTALAFSQDRSCLASGHDDGIVRIWELPRLRLLGQFAHDCPISALAFSPDGTRVASAGEDKVVHLWNARTQERLGSLEAVTDRIQALAWHPEGQYLVSASWDSMARVWDTTTLEPVILLNSHALQVTALTFSPDGRLLASADSAQDIHVWDFKAQKIRQVLKGHPDQIACLAFSPDGQTLASGGADRVIRLWDCSQRPPSFGRREASRKPESTSTKRTWTSLTVSPDGSRLASNCGGPLLRVWDMEIERPTDFPGDYNAIHALAFSPDGSWIAGGGADARFHFWDANTGRLHLMFADEDQPHPVTCLAFAPDSSMFASAGATDTSAWVRKVPSGEPVLLIPDAIDGCTIESLAFHPQGHLLAISGIDWLATGGSNGAIAVWDLVQRREVALFAEGASCVTFDPSGRWLASASLANSVNIWDMEAGQLARELTGHDDAITWVVYSPDGRWLASSSDDRTVRLWDAQTGKPAAVTELDTQVKILRFSPDGRSLFTGNGNTTTYQLDVNRLLQEGV